MTDEPVVLIVEDEPSVAEGYELWIGSEYETRVAYDGPEALEMLDEEVDVVMLDRMLPEMSGGEVLEKIREREIDVRVVMVSAVEPDFDIVAMGFDAYITKPPERDELLDTLETLVERAELDDELQEYYSLMARKGTLEAEKTAAELAESAAYADLCEQVEAQRAVVDERLGDLETEEGFVGAARELFGEPETEFEDAPDVEDASEGNDG